MRKVARRVVAHYVKPILQSAKSLVPVESGRLRASLGLLQANSRNLGTFYGRVGTRRDFTYMNRKTKQRTSSGRASGRAENYAQDKGSPNLYAGGIEFGTDKRGRIVRKDGPARYLNQSIDSKMSSITSGIAERFRQEINRV
jgi:hypothetical protein